MFCGKCGANIPDGNTFCSICGAPINYSSDQSVVQATPQPIQAIPVIMVNHPTPARKTNGAAIAGLVFGIVTLFLCWVPYVGVGIGIIGFILSIIGISMISKCNSGGGPAITGLILSVVGVLIGLIFTLSLKAYLDRANAAYESVQQQSSTISIATSTQNIGQITFEVPSSWSYDESDNYQYFYPENNKTGALLMVFSQETGMDSFTKATFESYIDGMIEGFKTDAGMQNIKIDKKETDQKDNCFIGIINIHADFQDVYDEIMFYIVVDKRTGTSYMFSFTQPENISEEYKEIFNYITDSVKLS